MKGLKVKREEAAEQIKQQTEYWHDTRGNVSQKDGFYPGKTTK